MTIKYALMATTAAVLLTTGGIASAQQSAPAARDAAPAASGKMATTPSAAYHEIDDAKVKVTTMNGVTVKDLNDMAIYGSDGKKIGDVDRVLADSSNQPKAVAVDAGGFLGMGTHEVIFPLDRLTKGKEANRLQTSMTKDQVEKLDKWEARNDARRAPGTATGAGGQPATTVPAR